MYSVILFSKLKVKKNSICDCFIIVTISHLLDCEVHFCHNVTFRNCVNFANWEIFTIVTILIKVVTVFNLITFLFKSEKYTPLRVVRRRYI